MDEARFDTLTRVLATHSRRSLLAAAGGAALSALLGWGMETAAGPNRKKKKKKRKCKANCGGKVCGQQDGCGGSCTGCPQGNVCVNKQCVDDTCQPQCDGMDCGADDTCGGSCTRQQGCGTNQTCIDGGCVTTSCSPACTSGQHCCDALGFGTLGCWNCCDDQDCIDNAVFNARGQVICRSGGCNCPDELPALCPAGFGTAAQQCTDPRSDKRNCHPDRFTCGAGCPNDPDWECCDGACAFLPKCLANSGGWMECQTQHCGKCGMPCLGEGFGCCEGVCVDMTQDPNCGVCGNNCSETGEICEGGACHVCECEEEEGD